MFFSIPAPPGGALSEQGPGTPASLPTNPIGQGLVANTFSNTPASLELRVAMNSGGGNINSELAAAAGNNWSTYQLCEALDRIKYFIRQRGYIGGSGGPVASGAAFSDTTHTGNVTNGEAYVSGLSANANTLGWRPGMLISGTDIPANTTILAVSSDGLQLLMSANATGTSSGVTLSVTSASAVVPV
jgi:hypothetical protein